MEKTIQYAYESDPDAPIPPPSSCYEITQIELDRIEQVRLELHALATHNPQMEQMLTNLTPTLWAVTHRKRKRIS